MSKDLDIDLETLAEQYPDAAKKFLALKEALDSKTLQREGKDNFIRYVKHMWTDFIEGEHHKIFAQKLEDVANGKIKKTDSQHATKAYKVRICFYFLS